MRSRRASGTGPTDDPFDPEVELAYRVRQFVKAVPGEIDSRRDALLGVSDDR